MCLAYMSIVFYKSLVLLFLVYVSLKKENCVAPEMIRFNVYFGKHSLFVDCF